MSINQKTLQKYRVIYRNIKLNMVDFGNFLMEQYPNLTIADLAPYLKIIFADWECHANMEDFEDWFLEQYPHLTHADLLPYLRVFFPHYIY